MKTTATILLTFLSLSCFSQKKWSSFSKNDIAVMSIEMVAGYAQGFRDEVLYHPHAIHAHFPHFGNFWNIQYQGEKKFLNMQWDADHVLKGSVTALHLTAIVIKVGDLKDYPKKQRIFKILADMTKYYLSYKLGFFLSYNVTHKNKL